MEANRVPDAAVQRPEGGRLGNSGTKHTPKAPAPADSYPIVTSSINCMCCITAHPFRFVHERRGRFPHIFRPSVMNPNPTNRTKAVSLCLDISGAWANKTVTAYARCDAGGMFVRAANGPPSARGATCTFLVARCLRRKPPAPWYLLCCGRRTRPTAPARPVTRASRAFTQGEPVPAAGASSGLLPAQCMKQMFSTEGPSFENINMEMVVGLRGMPRRMARSLRPSICALPYWLASCYAEPRFA